MNLIIRNHEFSILNWKMNAIKNQQQVISKSGWESSEGIVICQYNCLRVAAKTLDRFSFLVLISLFISRFRRLYNCMEEMCMSKFRKRNWKKGKKQWRNLAQQQLKIKKTHDKTNHGISVRGGKERNVIWKWLRINKSWNFHNQLV